MRTFVLAAALSVPALLPAQDAVVNAPRDQASAAIIRDAFARPHALRTGSGPLQLPRDSSFGTTLIVVGRPTYLASRVQGNVVVIGSDLFLRPGVDISGRAIAIGGTVARTMLGRVEGGTTSFQDETYDVVSPEGAATQTLEYRALGKRDPIPLIQPAGFSGFLTPEYDRVDGLSLPVGALVTVGERVVEVVPRVTYRSRLGAFDPGVTLRVMPEHAVHFEGRAARDTRSNDRWIGSDLWNSVTTLFLGSDAHNYFRSDVGEGRLFARIERTGLSFEPFIGGRYEDVSSISATGNVYAFSGRSSFEKIKRPNPLVGSGGIGSVLLGGALFDTSGVVTTRLAVEMEQSVATPAATSNFFQLTADGVLRFPTFGTQRMQFRFHAVTTAGDIVTPARYAYLGGSGTMPNLDLLREGGDELLYIDSRYIIPIDAVNLPFVGSPTVTLRDLIGSAGFGSLPSPHHAIGATVSLSVIKAQYTYDVTGRGDHQNKFSLHFTFNP